MPEDQNESASLWNRRLNGFLEKVLHWQQLGTSNNDVHCDDIRSGKVGIDSVFAYKRNPKANQQVVIVEAKTVKIQANFNRSKLQEWIEVLNSKISCIPHSEDFRRKYNPETTAEYQLGLMAVWVRDSNTYLTKDIRTWLSQLDIASRRPPINICFISNDTIARFCAIDDVVSRSQSSGAYKDIRLFWPDLGTQPAVDGSCFPVETLLSKFLFFKTTKIQPSKRKDENGESYSSSMVFYTGTISDYHDLRLLGLAMKRFQLTEYVDADIYTMYDAHELRNQISTFKNEFADTKLDFNFRQLTVNNDFPSWLQQDD